MKHKLLDEYFKQDAADSGYHRVSRLLDTTAKQDETNDAQIAVIEDLRCHHTESKGDIQHVIDEDKKSN